MTGRRGAPHNNLTPALQAINNLAAQELNGLFNSGQMAAMIAHDEINRAPINLKTGIFYRHLVPLRQDFVFALAKSYRRCFKLTLARPRETGESPEQWAWDLIQPAVIATLEWIRDWHILACDGENQNIQYIGAIPFVPGGTGSLSIPLTAPPFPPPQSWRAPSWLFQVSPTLGIGPLKTEHVPANDSEKQLGAAHTRLLFKGARRVFLWELEAAMETVRNEEIAGAIPAGTLDGQAPEPSKRKARRTRDRKRMIRDKWISEIDDIAKTPREFLQLMDKRKVQPQPTWNSWPGSWVQAYKDPHLRRLIHQDKSRALSRVLKIRNR